MDKPKICPACGQPVGREYLNVSTGRGREAWHLDCWLSRPLGSVNTETH